MGYVQYLHNNDNNNERPRFANGLVQRAHPRAHINVNASAELVNHVRLAAGQISTFTTAGPIFPALIINPRPSSYGVGRARDGKHVYTWQGHKLCRCC